jgi:hypothetical protein
MRSGTKADLAYHYGLPHRNEQGRQMVSATPTRRVLKWRKDEIDSAHRDMHSRLGTPVELEFDQ